MSIDGPGGRHGSRRTARRWVTAAVAATLVGGLAIVSPTLAGQSNPVPPPEPPTDERYPVSTGEPPVTAPDPRYPDATGNEAPAVDERPASVDLLVGEWNEVSGPDEGPSPVDGQGVAGETRVDGGGVDGQDGGGRTDG